MFLVFSALIFVKCKPPMNRSDVTEVSKRIVTAVAENDTSTLFELSTKQGENFTAQFGKDLNPKIQTFKDKTLRFLAIDSGELITLEDQILGTKAMDIFFSIDSTYYTFNLRYKRDTSGNIYIHNLFATNISDACLQMASMPFRPEYQFLFDRFFTSINFMKNRIDFCQVEVQNLLSFDVEYFRFQVTIDDNSFNTLFSQTVEVNKKIFAGDKLRIDIPDLSNFYLGSKVNLDNLHYSASLLEVKPKPLGRNCDRLERLKLRSK